MLSVSVSLNTAPAMRAGTVGVDGPFRSSRVGGVAVETRLNFVRVGTVVPTVPAFLICVRIEKLSPSAAAAGGFWTEMTWRFGTGFTWTTPAMPEQLLASFDSANALVGSAQTLSAYAPVWVSEKICAVIAWVTEPPGAIDCVISTLSSIFLVFFAIAPLIRNSPTVSGLATEAFTTSTPWFMTVAVNEISVPGIAFAHVSGEHCTFVTDVTTRSA